MVMVEESSVQMKDGSSLNEETASISSLRLFILAPVSLSRVVDLSETATRPECTYQRYVSFA